MGMIYSFYTSKAGNGDRPQVLLKNQVDDAYSLGKSLTKSQISQLAAKAQPKKGSIALVLTADDVGVDDFCSTICGTHGTDPPPGPLSGSATQSPSACRYHACQYYNEPFWERILSR
jgi:Phosphate-induced protein 1 conserved region